MTRHLPLLILLLLILLSLAVSHLGGEMWTDEYRTMYYIGAAPQMGPAPTTFGESIVRLAENKWQSPGYYLLLWGWGRFVGWSVFALRLPSLFFGFLTIAVTYRLARRLYIGQVALYAALTLGLNGFFVNFLHEMRAYALFMLLCAVMLWLYLRIVDSTKPRFGTLALFSLSVTGLLYTHYFAIFPIAGLGLCHLLLQRKHPFFWHIMGGFALAGLLFLPWTQVVVSGAQLSLERDDKNLSVIEAGSSLLYFFSNSGEALMLGLIVLALRQKFKHRAFFVLWFAFSFGLMLGMTRIVPALREVRYMIFFWPVLGLFIGLGMARLIKHQLSPRWVMLLWIVFFIGSFFNETYQQRQHPWATPPFQALAAVLRSLTQPGDALIYVIPPHQTSVRTVQLNQHFYGDDLLRAVTVHDTYVKPDDAFRIEIGALTEDAKRVWLSHQPQETYWRIDLLRENFLPELGYAACGVAINEAKIHAELFATQPDDANALSFTVDNDKTITVYILAAPQILNDHLLLNVGWALSPTLAPGLHSIGIHLDDATGQLVRQIDIGITQAGFGCQLQAVDIADLPTGDYTLNLMVYNWQTGERLPNVQALAADDNRVLIDSFTLP